jgi:signal transduction histidine kinase
MIQTRLTVIIALFLFQTVNAQSNPDSLIREYSNLKHGKAKVDKLYEIYNSKWRSSKTFYFSEIIQLIDLSKTLNYQEKTAELYNLFGLVNRVLNRPGEAAKAYFDGLKYAEKAAKPELLADLHMSLGTLFCMKRSFKSSRTHLGKAIEIALKYNLKSRQANIFQQFGVFYGMQDNVDSSFYYQKLALSLINPNDNIYDYSSMLLNLGVTYKKLKDYKKAHKIYDQTELIADTTKDEFLKAATIINRGWVYFETENYNSALESAIAGIDLARNLDDLDFELDALDLKQKSLLKLGQYKAAYEALSAHRALTDTIFNKDKIRQARDLNIQYEVELKDSNILQEKLRNSRIRWVAIVLFISLAIIISLIMFNNRKMKRKNFKLRDLNIQIASTNHELSKLNNVKTILFSIISHDLRGPLNTLRLFIDRMKQGKIPEEKTLQYISEIGQDIHHAGELIDNLLDWARTQLEGYKTNIESLELKQLVDNEIEKLTLMAKNKDISFENTIDESELLKADKELTSIIIRNLIGNAIKFSPWGKSIVVSFSKSEQVLTVLDQGSGLSENQIQTINRGAISMSSKGTANEKGNGMGLMICQQLAALMDSKIEMQSNHETGTSARLCFGA